MSGDRSISPSVRVDWGTPQASASTTTSAAPDASSMSRLDRVIEEYLASDDPIPARTRHEIGDGDFRAIGSEYLRYFVELGGLTPMDNVLDIGCGFGRMALPLTRYLAPTSRYHGFDIVEEPVAWCRANISSRMRTFHFDHIDLQHSLYNPHGTLSAPGGFYTHLSSPQSWKPTFVIAISVLTHLNTDDLLLMLQDAGSALPCNGRLFVTAFLTGQDTPPVTDTACFPLSEWRSEGPLTALRGPPTTAAVGIAWPWLAKTLIANGFRPKRLRFGHWRAPQTQQGPFQDLVVAHRHPAPPSQKRTDYNEPMHRTFRALHTLDPHHET